ncbi:MAG TPA: translational GTPase TypA [Elusimicrobia bacterium]|nr:MAG: GTP-binding protein TypA [Elusimicrobia bacterium GWA2_66_18]HAZ07994.1 translational GTPase TypA [Elusimicrobiota bacterium]
MISSRRKDVRNIAIIAHVDHGKTTLVDALLKYTGAFNVKADAAQEQVLDSNDLERERGITILAKNTSIKFEGAAINIVDTPGHADFGSEVERILKMVDGALLVVDAVEGPMPQTRFVLRKALALGLHPIVVINKMDRPHIRPQEALNKIFDLFIDLGATDPQMDFAVVYAAGKAGWSSHDAAVTGVDMKPLCETILKSVPGPMVDPDKPLQMLITMLDYSSYIGKIGIGRVQNGEIVKGGTVALIKAEDGKVIPGKITMLQMYDGLKRKDVEAVKAGDIVALAGLESINVGDTVSSVDNPVALPPLEIDEPTLSMEFMVNNSPFSGREGKLVTSRHIRERLLKEQQINVGLKIEQLSGEGHFKVSGRGELHLSILIETMRREGFELAVSRPQVIFREINGRVCEPMENLVVDVPADYQGTVIETLGRRIGQLQNMAPEGRSRVRLEYVISSRGLMGFKSELMAMTKGTGMMHHSFHGYGPKGSEPPPRPNGVLIAMGLGSTTGYALSGLQERSDFFLAPGVEVYEGMIVGTNSRATDMIVNPCKAKALTNMRSKATDDAIQLEPPRILSLEQALEFIDEDELLEVTPKSIRLRKKVLNGSLRKRSEEKG